VSKVDFLLAFLLAIVQPNDTPGGPIPVTVSQMHNSDTPGGPIPVTLSQMHNQDTPGGPIPVSAR
jgi:hypothetical protein